jgi:hypothetical protein
MDRLATKPAPKPSAKTAGRLAKLASSLVLASGLMFQSCATSIPRSANHGENKAIAASASSKSLLILPMAKKTGQKIVVQRISIDMLVEGDLVLHAIKDDYKKPFSSVVSIDAVDKKTVYLHYDFPYDGAPEKAEFGEWVLIGHALVRFGPGSIRGSIKAEIIGYDDSYPVSMKDVQGNIIRFIPTVGL